MDEEAKKYWDMLRDDGMETEIQWLEYVIRCCENTGDPKKYGMTPQVLQLCKMAQECRVRIEMLKQKPIEVTIKLMVNEDGSIQASGGLSVSKEMDHVPKFEVIPTVYDFVCRRWFIQVGKKEAETCHGCTVQCHMKNKYKPSVTKVP